MSKKFWRKIFLAEKKFQAEEKNYGSSMCRLAVGSWQVAVERWQLAGGMWPNCLGAVRKAGIMCPHQLVVGGGRDGAGAAGGRVLSTFYVLKTNTLLGDLATTYLNSMDTFVKPVPK